MVLDFQLLGGILERKSKIVNAEELGMLKKWFETNEELMRFKNENNIIDDKKSADSFLDFHMDIFDIIRYNDPSYRK